ncbi:MAG: hypothetical protein M1827_006181 [Pycnora praestabilis]|nr:MAG: hypothetical protein M1827_006181 [Pycnora praestabilis]
MSTGQHDPRLLYSIPNIRAHHIQNGEESSLTPSGAQTLSLLMVPTSSPFNDTHGGLYNDAPEEDFYLHLHLPPELDLPLPATTQIYHQPPNSYLIPRWDLGPDAGAFTRIEFPGIGSGPDRCSQEDVDTFETILAQCTAFLERATAPSGGKGGKGGAAYNPADYGVGQTYVHGASGKETMAQPGHIVLIDEENGSVVGELNEGFNVVEHPSMEHGSKNPVEISLPAEGQGNQISVRPVSEEYLRMSRHPAYKDSTIVSNAATASRLIVTGSSYISSVLTSGAESFTQKTKPNPKPMTFTPTTQARARKLNSMTVGAAGLSAKTVGQVSKHAQNLGATLARRGEKQTSSGKGMDKDGKPVEGYKPGILNKSMMAFSTIADGVDVAARQLLSASSTSATTVVGHRYGPDARNVAADLAGGVKNVGLVYVDAAGVSRRAVVKSVAKGMVVGRVAGGGDLVVGGGDGGEPPMSQQQQQQQQGGPNMYSGSDSKAGMGGPGMGQQQGGYDNSTNFPPPPTYDSTGTEKYGKR